MFAGDTYAYDGIAFLDYDFMQERGDPRAKPEASTSTYFAPSLHGFHTSSIGDIQSPYLPFEMSSPVNDDASATSPATYLDSWPSAFDPTFDPIFDLSSISMGIEHCAVPFFLQPTAIDASESMDHNMDTTCLQGLVGADTTAPPYLEDSQERFDTNALSFVPENGHTNSSMTQHRDTSRASKYLYGHMPMGSILETSWQDTLHALDTIGLEFDPDGALSCFPQDGNYRRRDSVLGTCETSEAPSSGQRCPKLYFCTEPSCKSAGFVYHFDLKRHKRTVHGGLRTGYRCTLPGCPKADKLWTRHDSYKKHVKNHHSGIQYSDLEDLKRFQPDDESHFPFSITTQQMMTRKKEDAEHTK